MKNNHEQTYFMNYATGGNIPKAKYRDLKEAQIEAQRLCKMLRVKVYTVAIVSTIEPASEFLITEFDGLPF